jgi:hypothetical protein
MKVFAEAMLHYGGSCSAFAYAFAHVTGYIISSQSRATLKFANPETCLARCAVAKKASVKTPPVLQPLPEGDEARKRLRHLLSDRVHLYEHDCETMAAVSEGLGVIIDEMHDKEIRRMLVRLDGNDPVTGVPNIARFFRYFDFERNYKSAFARACHKMMKFALVNNVPLERQWAYRQAGLSLS